MGTPEFAVPSLNLLLKNREYNICAMVTKPDRPVGRKREIIFSPVKFFAIEHGIRFYQPEKLKDNCNFFETLKNYNLDLIIVIAYGKILPKEILEIPKLGCINVHGSLLPKYRGAAPIQWSIINGEKITGVTTMYMDEGMDTGDILLSEQTYIDQNETSGDLYKRLSKIGANLLIKTLENLSNISRKKQNEAEATYCDIIKKNFSQIDWNNSAENVHNLVRGANPWPIAYTNFGNKILKIYKTKISNFEYQKNKMAGKVVNVKPLVINCKFSTLEILTVQPESKKIMSALDFVNGNNIDLNTRF
ncbi:MAG: methionyl-tRNA formyltransferase [Candidatus Paraimprobicoccus trichonymphae]|uniref:Methionyl-tRNA formyltransferase n=1 Tax=Candidatus Paraimprobicoccus trichonymphae TaxID=3033793 RepID=A0AA48I6N1_9FIRM|nr:MAG: methionyl-tRNA formyltransferase [Candidatus Paraimprobicoccus trichonymphae]